MIIARIYGGLGNQMFQYAAGRRLACRHHTQLKLDTSWYERFDERGFQLDIFNFDVRFASKKEVADLLRKSRTRKLFNRFWPLSQTHITANGNGFDDRVLTLGDNVLLDGYWQSERYFADIANTIRRDFEFEAPLEGENRALAARIQSCVAVSLHVRRGDYVENAVNLEKYASLDTDYYLDCISRMNQIEPEAQYFVFSDDQQWVGDQLGNVRNLTIVDINDTSQAHEDLRLMSMCRHNIIANSTFSWWGAWLNRNADKKVFAPKQWFSKKSGRSADHVIPESWIHV
jgi:hypothetical protein